MSDNPLVDDRDRQGTLDIGEAAARTDGRESSLLGSDAFADDRESGSDGGEQFNLFSEEESLDGQASLGGGQASRESEGFFDLSGSDPGGSGGAFEASGDVESLFESAFGTPDAPPTGGGALGEIGTNLRAAESEGVLSPQPNGDAQQAPDGLFGGTNTDPGRPQSVDVNSLDTATDLRDEYGEFLHPDDHRGRTTVKFVADAPAGVIRQAEAAADETAAERATRSQTGSLSEGERNKIKSVGGFGESRTTANWRSAKGVFEREGLGDQFRDAIGSFNDYDDPIEGAEAYVERHKSRQAEAGVGGVGALDVGEEDISGKQRAGRAAAREQESLEESAIEGAKRGHQEAIDALVLEAGWDRAEAEALGQKVDDPTDSMTEPEFQRIVDAEIKRSRSSGRFAHDTNQTTLPGVNRRRTSGRFVSSPLADTEIGRNTDTGRFVDRGDR